MIMSMLHAMRLSSHTHPTPTRSEQEDKYMVLHRTRLWHMHLNSKNDQAPAHPSPPTKRRRRAAQQPPRVPHQRLVVDHAWQLHHRERHAHEHEARGRDVVERGNGVELDALALQEDLDEHQSRNKSHTGWRQMDMPVYGGA